MANKLQKKVRSWNDCHSLENCILKEKKQCFSKSQTTRANGKKLEFSIRMSDFSEEPRFTIEQIDLLQRLRRSGMSKREILHALETLDRLDREHGDKFGRRTSSSSSSSSTYTVGGTNSCTNNSASNNTASATTTSAVTCNGAINNGDDGEHSATTASSTTSKISTATQTQFGSNGGLSPSLSNNYDTSPPPAPPPPSSAILPSPVSLVALSQNGRDSLAATPNGKLSPPRYPVNSAAAARTFGFEAIEEDLDVDDKVEEMMRRDSSMVKEEIKAFLGNRRISQAVVAQVTGISQSRISHWLLQHGSDLSEQKKRAFYRWYTLEKTTPGATLNMRPAPLALEEMEWRQTPPPLATAPGTFRLRRGSRFTWRKECLAVMESYFNDNQYPDEAKREEIANACNAVIQKPGKKLSDLERVTSLKVYNWFANRRKEIKRRANIATILESHGIDVQSPGGHSNSDDIDGNDFTDQACDLPYFDKRPLSRPFGLYRLEPSSPIQEKPLDHVFWGGGGGQRTESPTLGLFLASRRNHSGFLLSNANLEMNNLTSTLATACQVCDDDDDGFSVEKNESTFNSRKSSRR
ncbi:homeobox-containing protein 1 isoform X2 [Hippocampus zosterae]|uniref:homeobox-containing protein 1 isoform X2 n=1 Tax=Hippocampus zosterae TaxID=109293 RepID=UPI00223CC90B|nr:homeobox-containing protein 1 isoform X2 [Hippocampus zosterae]